LGHDISAWEVQCRFNGTKIPYGMLFTEIFRHHMVDVAALKGMKGGSKITMKNIKQIRVKVSDSPLPNTPLLLTHQQSSTSRFST